MSKKAKRSHMSVVEDNIQAINDFNNNETKRLSINDLKTIKPLNTPQRIMFESYFSGNAILADGSAGTGKTFASVYLAMTDVLSKGSKQNKLIIVKSAVPAREIGFLPGTEGEKLESYEAPYKDIFADLFGRMTAYEKMKKQRVVDFVSTSFVRGLTWDNAVIIVDEIQNMTFYEINSVLTRVGANSKIIIIGDQLQTDLYRRNNDKSGMKDLVKIISNMEEFDHIKFTKEDIVRGAFVKSWICALEASGISL